jgi:RHS repeat-associated protein
VLDHAAADAAMRQLGEAVESLASDCLPELEKAEAALSPLPSTALSGAPARSEARRALLKAKGFRQAFGAYVDEVERYDHETAARIRDAQAQADPRGRSGWAADPKELERRILQRLIDGGMTQEDAEAFMDDARGSLQGLASSIAYCGDPVNTSTGNFVHQKQDLAVVGAFPLVLTRSYNSLGKGAGPLGPGWTHSFDVRLDDRGATVAVAFGDGRTEAFDRDGRGAYAARHGHNRLELREGAFVLVTKGRFELRFAPEGGVALALDPNGNETVYSYEGGLLAGVRSASGAIAFSYTAEGLLCEARDHAGRTVTYGYQDGCLACATHPGGAAYRYRYDGGRRLTHLIGPDGTAVLENRYDASSRVCEQAMADGSSLSFSYEDELSRTTATGQDGSLTAYTHDAASRTVRVARAGASECSVYDGEGNKTSFTDRNGNTHRFAYDGEGNLVEAADPLGNTTRIAYNGFSKPVRVENPDGGVTAYGYDGAGNLAWRTDPLGRTWRFEHTPQGLPCKATLPDGSTARASYDARGNLVEATGPAGQRQAYAYDALNRVVRSSDAQGNATAYAYDERGALVSATDALGNAFSLRYDPAGRVVGTTDRCGHRTAFAYDAMGRLARITDALGGATRFTYGLDGSVTSATDPLGNTTVYGRDAMGRLAAVSDPEGRTMRFGHDACGNITSVTEAGGARTSVEYDAANRPVRQAGPDGAEVRYAYDACGRLTRAVYQDGLEEARAYDAAGQLVEATDVRGMSVRFSYTPLGQISRIENQRGERAAYRYRPGGRLRSAHGPGGESCRYGWDALGRLESITDALGNTTGMAHDALGRLVEVRGPAGGARRIGYDPMGRTSSVTDANGSTTRYRYSPLGVLSEVVDAAGHSTRYLHDAARRLTGIERPWGGPSGGRGARPAGAGDGAGGEGAGAPTTRFERDRSGRVCAVHRPLGRTERLAYDADGRLASRQDAEGHVTTFGYTPFGGLGRVGYSDGRQVRFAYGAMRLLRGVSDWLGGTAIERDPFGQVRRVVGPDGCALGYEWDEVGRLSRLAYPDGSAAEYDYDASGRLSAVRAPDGTTSFTYDAAGRLVLREMPGNVVTRYASDAMGRLTRLTHLVGGRVLEEASYGYDGAGSITRMERRRTGAWAGSGVYDYSYDPLGRLASAAKDGSVRTFAYDGRGNRVAEDGPGGRREYRYDALDQLVSVHDGQRLEEYRYDGRGNLAEVLCGGESLARYRYDAANKLVQAATAAGAAASFSYDGMGNRVGVREERPGAGREAGAGRPGARAARFRYDITRGFGNLVGADYGDGMVQGYLWGNGLLAAFGAKGYRYLTDHLGTPVRLLDGGDGTALAYDEFGAALPPQGGGGGPCGLEWGRPPDPFGFAGHQTDGASGLVYAQARYYDPRTSRMASADLWGGSSGAPQTLNRYAYCVNNPVSLVDRNGRWPTIPTPALPTPPTFSEALGYNADVANVIIDDMTGLAESLNQGPPVVEGLLRGGLAVGDLAMGGVSLLGKVATFNLDYEVTAGDVGAALLNMERDSQGIFHARTDCWQEGFGYNKMYDAFFDLGTDMKNAPFEFTYDGADYTVWAWRGDYLNLGAGAELGIYRRHMDAQGRPTEHWDADAGLAMPMTLRLRDINGGQVFSYYPTDPQWWVTGFNEDFRNMPVDKMIALYAVDFSGDQDMFKAFRAEYENAEKKKIDKNKGLLFNPFTFTVDFTFAPAGLEDSCVI